MSNDRVDFTRSAAERIANVVRVVEGGDRDGQPLRFGRVFDAPGKVFRVCRMPSAAWSKGSLQTITFRNVTTTPNTVTAINLFAAISTSASTARSCAIAKEGTAWYLIAAECD